MTTTTYTFTVILAGVSEVTEAMADALFEAGCDDATPASSGGVVRLDFDREAESLGEALGSAVVDLEKAGCRVARIDIEPMPGFSP